MQVLRTGGEYLAGRRNDARKALGAIVGGGVIGVAIASIAVHPFAGILLGVMITPAAMRAHKRLGRVSKGIGGEVLVAECLESLSDDYFLLNDVILPGHPGNIDHVVIGPCGVVVIETKHYSGSIESHLDAWFANGRRCRSVSRQVNRNAVAVGELLARTHPDLKDSALRFVESVAVFTNPLSRVKADRTKTVVVRYSQLLEAIREMAVRKRVPRAVVARLAKSLKGFVAEGSPVPGISDRPGRRRRDHVNV